MNRFELEHVIRASAAIADDSHVVVIGSQAILGQYPDAPAELVVSMEADVYPKHAPERAIVIDGAIGELSVFHQTFGYYAHGVGPETATLPAGWQGRTISIQNENTNGAHGECLEAHDLAISKLAAGREKDLGFVRLLLVHGMVDATTLAGRIGEVADVEEAARTRMAQLLARASRAASTKGKSAEATEATGTTERFRLSGGKKPSCPPGRGYRT